MVTLASAKKVSALQALSRIGSFSSSAAAVSYVPEFLAYTETAVRSLPRTSAIQSLSDFVAGFPVGLLLCPIRALSEYAIRMSSVVTGLRGSLCRLVVLLVLCRKMVSLSCGEKSLLVLVPALGMLRPLGHTVFTA